MTATTTHGERIATPVEAYFAAQPTYGENPIGQVSRAAVVSALKQATPGRATTPYFVPGDYFVDIFFPKHSAAPYSGDVASVYGFDSSFMGEWAIAALCQTMANITSQLRPQMMTTEINGAMASSMSRIIGGGSAWYAHVLVRANGPVASSFNAIAAADRPTAAAAYQQALTSAPWVEAKIAQYNSGSWPSPQRDWELYHHWVKLLALGVDYADVNATIATAKSMGLPIPTDVDRGAWPSYDGWCRDSNERTTIDWNDLRGDAAPGILETKCFGIGGVPSCMAESNSFEFTANSQPGNKYRQLPSGSCFDANTRVLMADGTTKAISDVQVGDQVQTVTGPQAVLMVAKPLLLDRVLWSFEGADFGFTSTHPFVTHAALDGDAPGLAAVDPLRLVEAVPTLSREGVTKLGTGVELVQYTSNGLEPFTPPPLATQPPSDETTVLYDLVVDVTGTGTTTYFVGDGAFFVAVASEIPRYRWSPLATSAVVEMTAHALAPVAQVLADAPATSISDLISVGLDSVASELWVDVLSSLGEPDPRAARSSVPASIEDLDEFVAGAIALAGSDDLASSLFEMMIRTFGNVTQSAIELGWRSVEPTAAGSATMLAASIYSVELDGSAPFDPGTSLECRVSLRRAAARTQRLLRSSIPDDRSGYFHGFNDVAYFGEWRADPSESPWMIEFELLDNDGTPTGLAACDEVPSNGLAFSAASAVVSDESGPRGIVTYDLRALTAERFAAEQAARTKWDSAAKHNFAARLGPAAGAIIGDRFSNSVRTFGGIASAQSRTVLKPPEPVEVD